MKKDTSQVTACLQGKRAAAAIVCRKISFLDKPALASPGDQSLNQFAENSSKAQALSDELAFIFNGLHEAVASPSNTRSVRRRKDEHLASARKPRR
jgi:hypothetical protein